MTLFSRLANFDFSGFGTGNSRRLLLSKWRPRGACVGRRHNSRWNFSKIQLFNWVACGRLMYASTDRWWRNNWHFLRHCAPQNNAINCSGTALNVSSVHWLWHASRKVSHHYHVPTLRRVARALQMKSSSRNSVPCHSLTPVPNHRTRLTNRRVTTKRRMKIRGLVIKMPGNLVSYH